MRFFSDGPNIPDLLLERRDQGRVVFLCGAGVSLNAGMPTFPDLTRYVINFFDPPEDSLVATSFRPWNNELAEPKVPLDQIFHLLYQEYGRDDVNALVAKRLQSEGSGERESNEHKIIARLSADQEGKPQIVTTNFDLLFESAMPWVDNKIYEPPEFPDISLGVSLTGITYLHGRLQDLGARRHPYILSSADFGRAYLSEGWATNFIRCLLDRFTVVLVGYQAEDPPVKYLLQGLNHNGLSDRSKLYAFDKGRSEDIEAKWRDRGVSAIAYEDHSHLWQSLEAWAERADDPRKWRSDIVNLATKGPRAVAAFERGQVAHLVRTTPGARIFANSDAIPPAEWLCVFDAACRAGKVSHTYGDNKKLFDPLVEYGLDDDPSRPLESTSGTYEEFDQILEWRRGDTNPPDFHRLGGRQVAGFERMPPRLSHLTRWIAKHLDSPVAAWWFLRQNGLHPRVAEEVSLELRKKRDLHPDARRTWALILEYQSDDRNFYWDGGWFELRDQIKNEGWNQSTLRCFEEVSAPILSRNSVMNFRGAEPPYGSWGDVVPEKFAAWEVTFSDRHGVSLYLSDDFVGPVFSVIEKHLFRAADLLRDTKAVYFNTPTCYPNREVAGQEDGDGEGREQENILGMFLGVFDRLVKNDPYIARAHVMIWPIEEEFFFRKIKLFALNHTDLFSADEAAEILLSVSQDVFWDERSRRELLFLICDRWKEFSEENKFALGERLLDGPDKRVHWGEDNSEVLKDEFACRYTRWLTYHGVDLPEKLRVSLDDKISSLPDWRDSWAIGFATEHYSRSYLVRTDESPESIMDLPDSKVLEEIEEQGQADLPRNIERRPFNGLVKENPRKALAVISSAAKSGVYPAGLWAALINEWPDEASARLLSVLMGRMCQLPENSIREINGAVGWWIEKRFVFALEIDRALAWKTFDHLVAGLRSNDGEATNSNICESSASGELQERSRRTIMHALNGSMGNATEGLLRALDSLKLKPGKGIPVEYKRRIELLVGTPGEGGGHVVVILSRNISWLYVIDPQWVMSRIVPWFDFESPVSEPAWNGYLSAARLPPQELGAHLKKFLVYLFPQIYQWRWDDNLATIAAQMTIEVAVLRQDEPDGLTPKEARQCLRNMDEKNRKDAISRLSNIGKRKEGAWSSHVVPFVHAVWPRERRFRTASLVSSWVHLLADAGDYFPMVLDEVRRFLVPVKRGSHWLHRFRRDMGDEQPLTLKYPKEVLGLLDAVVSNSPEDIPYELSQILDLIEEVDPSLVRDRRFMRLIDLIEQA